MPLLSSLGLISLALAGLSGWLVLATMQQPRWFADRGVVAPMRFRQLHLDWVSMGLILIAVDQVVPDRPAWITALLAFGLIVNPLLFVPLAWGREKSEQLTYRVVTGMSFVAASGGLTALAVYALV
jgi:hydroxylaminobenzene mutase